MSHLHALPTWTIILAFDPHRCRELQIDRKLERLIYCPTPTLITQQTSMPGPDCAITHSSKHKPFHLMSRTVSHWCGSKLRFYTVRTKTITCNVILVRTYFIGTMKYLTAGLFNHTQCYAHCSNEILNNCFFCLPHSIASNRNRYNIYRRLHYNLIWVTWGCTSHNCDDGHIIDLLG